jgi:nucleoside transporter
MMVLEFFIWGAWLPLIFGYLPTLGFTPAEQSWILNSFPIAAIVAMFVGTQFVDRHFAAERFLAFSQLVGGLAILALAWVQSFWPFLGLMLLHCLFYVPTISITNSIAFANMRDPQSEFGLVRMGGTIGWILAAWPLVFLLEGRDQGRSTSWIFIIAGVASLALAAFSLSLPHTPPRPSAGTDKLAWLRAVKLLALPFVLVLWLVTFVDATVHQCYFNWTGRFLAHIGIAENWIMPVMSIGQIAEIVAMALLGSCLKALGWRRTMVIGILGHAIRFAVFAFFPQQPWLVVAVIALHGICYAFFFATVYIFVDEFFPKDVRASAQGLFNFMILGLGQLLANFLGPWMIEVRFNQGGVVDFKSLFLVPCVAALAAAAALAIFFRPPRTAALRWGEVHEGELLGQLGSSMRGAQSPEG